jgi:diguanylate cyclase (GGDEF)-like protein/PAS domain S-box-containing protein
VAPPPETLRILLVEDDEDDYLITRDMLADQDRARFQLDWAQSYADGLERIAERAHDVYLVDYRLGARTGLDLVREGFASRPSAPVILLTGQSEYDVDLEATALGVTDYVVKNDLTPTTLERSIRYSHTHHKAMLALSRIEERYSLVVNAANDGIWDWDLMTDTMYFSPRWHTVLGRPAGGGESDPSTWFDLVHTGDLLRLRAAIDAHIGGHTAHLQSEHRMRHADGTWRWVLTRGLAMRGVDGQATRIAGSMSDITDRRRAEEQLQHDALHDALTGLPNRALFIDRVEQTLQRSRRDPTIGAAVLFVDVDRFKLVNDSLSHAVGDHLLIAVAHRIAGVLRPGDTVARLGGDEFVILLDGVTTVSGARIVADRLMAALRNSFSVDRHELVVTASVGMALTAPRMTSGEVIRNADIAMYDAKRQGGARAAQFDESMHRRVVDRLNREKELRQAVEQGLLGVHFQPIVDLQSGRIIALEALARWPAGWPAVPPTEFIPVAEETGLIGALGQHVLRVALSCLASWRSRGILRDDVSVSVNVSSKQLEDPALAGQVRGAVAMSDIGGDALWLEITESTLMHDLEHMAEVVADVCAGGARLALDDFGTGYSSLSVLHAFPIRVLKIDRSFIASVAARPDVPASNGVGSEAIIRSTVALAHSLGMKVIAEGIEDQFQLERIRDLGCDYGQGFLFSPALPPDEVEELIEKWNPLVSVGRASA